MQVGPTILLADDNPGSVALIGGAFRALGFAHRLISVNDGGDAIACLNGWGPYADREQFPLPGLILLDLDMPRINGFQFLSWLRTESHFKHLPVVVLTVSAYSSDVRTAYLLGANSFLSKPPGYPGFLSAVRQMCEFWLGACQLPDSEHRSETNQAPASSPGPGIAEPGAQLVK